MGRKEKSDRYAEKMIERMITQIANEKSAMGRDFRLLFEPLDPAGILKDKNGSTGIQIEGHLFADFMENQWKKGNVSKAGALRFFACSFIFHGSDYTNLIRMLKYVKEKEFSLEEYERCYEELPLPDPFPGNENPVVAKLTNYAVWKALNGHEKIRESFIALYKKNFKREYNVIKKFSRMDYSDVLHVISDDDYTGTKEIMFLSRLLFFAPLKGIELEKPALFYELLNRLWEDLEFEDKGFKAFDPLPSDYVLDPEEFTEARDLMGNDYLLHRAADTYDSILSNSEINSNYSLFFKDDNLDQLKEMAPFYVAAMNDVMEDASDEEKAYGLVFSWIVNKAKENNDEKMLECEQLLGLASMEGDDFLKEIWETSAKKETPAQASVTRNALLAEIQNLKRELESRQSELEKSREKIAALEKNLLAEEREKERFARKLEEMKKELPPEDEKEVTEEEETVKPEATKEEKIEFLKSKKFCVIGGHQNWVYKVREMFPEWTFVKAKATGTTSDDVIKSIDRVFFFTDTLSHVSYSRFVNLARSFGIPCSYLHSINLNRIIDELYENGIKEKEG